MLKNRDALLADLAFKLERWTGQQGFQKGNDPRVHNIRVSLYAGRKNKPIMEFLGLPGALRAIVEGLYFDEENDWSEADRVELDTY